MKYAPYVLGVLSLLVWGCQKPAADAPSADDAKPVVEVSTVKAHFGEIRSVLKVTGSASPLPNHEAKVSPLAPGRIKAILVKTGDTVVKGQVIATLDPGPAVGQVHQAEAAVRVAEATLQQARVNLVSQTRAQEAAVEQASTNLDSQNVALAKLRAGSRPQEIAQSQYAVAAAEAALTNATQNLNRSQTLLAEGLLARKDFESAQAAERAARAGLASAQQALSLVKQGNRPEDVRAGEIAVQQARQQLQTAKSQSIQNQSKLQDIRISEGQLQSARGALQSARSLSKALTIVSPLAGTVVGRTVNAGESVDVTSALVTIVNLDQVRLLLNVPSDRIQGVRPSEPVEFTIDSDPGVSRYAKVSAINRAVDPATNVVVVEALASNEDSRIKDDSFVRAAIVTERHSHVVLVPASALVEKEGKTLVFVGGADGIAHARPVEVGLTDNGLAEIRNGVRANDTVITTGAYELDDGTRIKVSK